MNRFRMPLVGLVFLVSAAALAWAATEAELVAAADALRADYVALETRVDADVEERAVLRAEADGLDVRRLSLWSDRSALPPDCECIELDGFLADSDALANSITRTMGEWDEID